MAQRIEPNADAVQDLAVRLLERVRRENRCMTVSERQRFSVSVRMIARCCSRSVTDVIASLERTVDTRR